MGNPCEWNPVRQGNHERQFGKFIIGGILKINNKVVRGCCVLAGEVVLFR